MASVTKPILLDETGQRMADILAEQVEVLKQIALKEGAYVTLAVTAATRDGATVTGQTVTCVTQVWDDSTSAWVSTTKTYAYNGETIAIQVPFKAKYAVSITDTLTTRNDGLYDHFGPNVAEGTALIDTAITLTYLDGENIESPTEFDRAETAIKAQYDNDAKRIEAGQTFLIGSEVPDTWTQDDGTTTIDDPLICVDFGECEDENGDTFIGATLMRKWATVNSIIFDFFPAAP